MAIGKLVEAAIYDDTATPEYRRKASAEISERAAAAIEILGEIGNADDSDLYLAILAYQEAKSASEVATLRAAQIIAGVRERYGIDV